MAISPEHVNAINLVEVDFYKCRKVGAGWKKYQEHLNDSSKPEDQAWRDAKEKLLAQLLFEIAAVIGFKIPAIPAIEIFNGGYAPKAWVHRDNRATGALEYVYELSQGTKAVPMSVLSFPVSQDAMNKQNLVHDALLKTLCGEQPLRIKPEA
jgi:hypothetical protein